MAKKYTCYYYCSNCRAENWRLLRLGFFSQPPGTCKCYRCGKKADYVRCEENEYEGS